MEVDPHPFLRKAEEMKSESMFGFAQNENYATFDFFDIVRKYRDRIFGIYGAEHGLFDQPQLEQIRSVLPDGHFRLVQGASHAVFQHQRGVFVERIKAYSAIDSVNSCAAIFGR